jgi:hypothetical protein
VLSVVAEISELLPSKWASTSVVIRDFRGVFTEPLPSKCSLSSYNFSVVYSTSYSHRSILQSDQKFLVHGKMLLPENTISFYFTDRGKYDRQGDYIIK